MIWQLRQVRMRIYLLVSFYSNLIYNYSGKNSVQYFLTHHHHHHHHHHQQQQQNSDLNDDEETITLCENEKDEQQHQQPSVRALARQFEQKTNSLPDHNRSKLKTSDQTMHHATARTIINEQQEENDEDETTWPQQPPPTSTQTSGIKKFVRNGLKLFNNNKTKKPENN